MECRGARFFARGAVGLAEGLRAWKARGLCAGAFAFDPSLVGQAGKQIFLWAVALDGIAIAAEKLQIADVIRAALGARDDVVDAEVTLLEMLLAAVAEAALLAVEEAFVARGIVGRQAPQVGARRRLAEVGDVGEQAEFVRHAPLHQFGGFGRDVDAGP